MATALRAAACSCPCTLACFSLDDYSRPAALWSCVVVGQARLPGRRRRADPADLEHDLSIPVIDLSWGGDMIHVTPTSRAPLFVNKFLLANEHQVVCVRFHLAKLLGPASLVFAGLIAAALLSSVTHGNGLAAVWLAWGVLLLWLIWKLLNWLVDYFVVTSKRVLLATGLLVRKVEMMPLVKVTDMSYQQSLRGRALKYGRFIFESAGHEQALREVDYIPDPEQHYLEVCGLIFADEDRADSGILRRVIARRPGAKANGWRCSRPPAARPPGRPDQPRHGHRSPNRRPSCPAINAAGSPLAPVTSTVRGP